MLTADERDAGVALVSQRVIEEARDRGRARADAGYPSRVIRDGGLLGGLSLGDGRVYATSRSFWASASDCSFFSDWFSIWRIRSRVTLNVRPTSSSVRGCSPPRP